MPNIAQQDYIRIEVQDFDNPTAAEIAELKKAVANGTILDTILVGERKEARVLAHIERAIYCITDTPGIAEIYVED